MRLLPTLLGASLFLSASASRAEHRISSRLTVRARDEAPASEDELPLEPSLVPLLEPPALEELEIPFDLRGAIVSPHLVMTGQVRGPMLDRCRARVRNLVLIGHGASTDGRPETCRLLAFMARQQARERAISRRPGVRTRFAPMRIVFPSPMPHFVGRPGKLHAMRGISVSHAHASSAPHTHGHASRH